MRLHAATSDSPFAQFCIVAIGTPQDGWILLDETNVKGREAQANGILRKGLPIIAPDEDTPITEDLRKVLSDRWACQPEHVMIHGAIEDGGKSGEIVARKVTVAEHLAHIDAGKGSPGPKADGPDGVFVVHDPYGFDRHQGKDPGTRIPYAYDNVPRHFAKLLARFGSRNLAEIVSDLWHMHREGQLTQVEAWALADDVVESHVDHYGLQSPEYTAVLRQADARCQEAGFACYAEVLSRFDYTEGQEAAVPRLKDLRTPFAESFMLYKARLLRECGCGEMARMLETSRELYASICASGHKALEADPYLIR